MICASCDRDVHNDDYLCEKCRTIEDLIESQDYAESDKYNKIVSEHGAILTKFLDWIDAQGYFIAKYDEVFPGARRITEDREPIYVPISGTKEDTLRAFFEIDSVQLELERRAMLESLRRI